jgi:hypothetical protein
MDTVSVTGGVDAMDVKTGLLESVMENTPEIGAILTLHRLTVWLNLY